MEQLTKNRSLSVLLVAVLFLALFAIYSYLLKPSADQITDQQAEIERLNNEYNLLSKKLAEKKEESNEYSKENVQQALPLWDNTEQLLLDLQQIESSTGGEALTATFTPDRVDDQENADTSASENTDSTTNSSTSFGPNVKQLKVGLVIKGKYADILRYIEELQKLPRLITVDSFDVAKSSSLSGDAKPISANLAFTAYFDPSYKSLAKDVLLPFEEK
ncbi:hypothetical protein [Paenibacillus lignilyticus]|uniref:Type IV pilus assembly protein PilO n=1 Tax=Paenibacillus lignilyticus TaxID=1172615 RepID=A0ABS5CLZ9_9BACL|nr:hypothetical protein [Paenibacillus lignilyticus]MBP3966850.1 hypothetical protein [Paenibacillus lignilyticus]